ncbi:MAG: hypothetical protein LQ339_005030 [Xanthoria mediterranea]|nr:MAG: hypothetical protein LQ339_005030 [Xanthoria mediterranea]
MDFRQFGWRCATNYVAKNIASLISGLASNVVNQGYSHSATIKEEHMGTIEVVVLRSIELQRPKAPVPSVSELHPITFEKPDSPEPLSSESFHSPDPNEDTDMSDLGGLFDGTSDIKKRHIVSMPFGGDMAWDDFDQHNRGQHFSTDWTGGSQQRNAQNSHRGNGSQAPSRSSSIPAASPAVQIFVNQPTASSPAPWSATEPPQWRRAPGSVADSWGTPAPGSQSGHNQPAKPRSSKHKTSQRKSSSSSSGGSKNMNTNGGGWDTNHDEGWGKSTDQPTNDQSQNVPGAWDASTKGKQPQSGGYGWDRSGGTSVNWNGPHDTQDNNGRNAATTQGTNGQNNDAGWDNPRVNNRQQDTGWDTWNNDDNDQGKWESNGQNSTPNNAWGGGNYGGDADDSNDGNEGWNSGQNGPNDQDSAPIGGGDAKYGNGQGNYGWNNTGQGGSSDNQHYNHFGGQANNPGDAWENAKVGAKESQASHAPNWNTSASHQNDWGQSGGAKDMFPATTAVSDPTKTRSRRTSLGKANITKSNLSQQATMNSVAQSTGRKHTNSVHGNGGGLAQPGQQQTGPPGAWPDTSHNAAGLTSSQSGPAAGIKPYHVIPDAAGNPRLPIHTPISPLLESIAPMPSPVKLAETSHHVQRGSPALYQHKTASPRYIDTHDKPYASFIFKYRPKAVLEQILNLTIPNSDDVEKAKLAHLSKEELIEQVIKTKSQWGSKISPTISSLSAVPPSVNNNNGWNAGNEGNYANSQTGAGPTGGALATNLHNKLAALAGPNNSSNSNPGWNNAPPKSPLANNCNTNSGGPPNGCTGGGGELIDTWLSKTPVGNVLSEHEPWNGAGSIKNGGASNIGGNAAHNLGNWGGNKTNNDAGGGWNGSDRGNTGGGGSMARNQKSGAKSQRSVRGWNDNSGDGGWVGDGSKHGGSRTQTVDWKNKGNNNSGGGGWDERGNANGWNGGHNQRGDQSNHWDGGNQGNGGGGWEN